MRIYRTLIEWLRGDREWSIQTRIYVPGPVPWQTSHPKTFNSFIPLQSLFQETYTMPSSKPTLVLVPGSFALPDFYSNVVSAVKQAGYDIHTIHNLSTGLKANEGRPEGPHDMYEDAAQIAETISKLSDEGKDIVLFAHSYGGVPATESLKGLSKEAREKDGKKGGVVRIAYMTCIVPAIGATAALGEVPEETRMGINGYGLEIDVRFLLLSH